MAERTPDEAQSTPQRGPTARGAAVRPRRLDISGNRSASPGSTVSSITTGTGRRRGSALPADRTQWTIAELAEAQSPLGPWTDVPAIPFDPVAFENAYDRSAYSENPGAEDSEEEDDDDVDNVPVA